MQKTINIGDKEVRLDNNIGWTMEYRNQEGKDIIPTLLPLIASILDLFAGVIKETGKANDITIKDMLSVTDTDDMLNAIIHASGAEFVDLFINTTWALAKCADESIPEPRRWVKQFDTFPLDEIVPQVLGFILDGTVSRKNLERLKGIRVAFQPIKKTNA